MEPNAVLRELYRSVAPKRQLSNTAKLSVFKSIFVPILTYGHGRPQKFFHGGGKVDILLIFLRLLAMQRKWTSTKKKLSNVTATVAYSVFLIKNVTVSKCLFY